MQNKRNIHTCVKLNKSSVHFSFWCYLKKNFKINGFLFQTFSNLLTIRIYFNMLCPPFGTCLCSNCWDKFSRICRVVSRLFALNTSTHWCFFRFCLEAFLVINITQRWNGCVVNYDSALLTRMHIIFFLNSISVLRNCRFSRTQNETWKHTFHSLL